MVVCGGSPKLCAARVRSAGADLGAIWFCTDL